MFTMLSKKMSKKRKGFTLIELIVVIAILGILAAIAIPRFSNMRYTSMIKSDATTAAAIVNAARIQETETGKAVTGLPGETPADTDLKGTYISVNNPQSGGTFVLFGGGTNPYKVKWQAESANVGDDYDGWYILRENEVFPSVVEPLETEPTE